MRKQKYEMIGETDRDIVTVITTAKYHEDRLKKFYKKYPDAKFLMENELLMYR